MMNNEMIQKLEGYGFNRWTKGTMDRLYINARDLGLECVYYNTGNIRGARFCGTGISNCEARRMKAAKTYIDIKTGIVYSDNRDLAQRAEEILEEVRRGA